MILQCPGCECFRIKKYSRRKYFIKSVVCLVLILLCYLEFNALIAENDVDRVILIGLFGSLILSVLAVIFGILYFIKAVLTKETIYKCEYCKSKLDSESLIRLSDNDQKTLLKNIKKSKHSIRNS